MIEENALIAATDGQWAWLETERKSTCGNCSARGGCGVSLLEKISKPRTELVRAINRAHAEVGDRVIVGISESALVKGSAIVYLSPLLGLFGGAALAEALAPFNSLMATEPASIMLGLGGLAAGLFHLWRFSRRNSADPLYQPVVLRTRTEVEIKPVEFTTIQDQNQGTSQQ